MNIAVTGASGLVGRALCASLESRGHRVFRLVRRLVADEDHSSDIHWSPSDGILDPDAFADIDAVVHLAGRSLSSGRWNERRKGAIWESRILGTRTLVDAIGRADPRPRTFLSASAIGYYGKSTGDALLQEAARPGDDFLASVCLAWENEAMRAAEHGVRVVRCRLGLVLDPEGGTLAKLLRPYKAGLGGKVGSGRQWMSWITLPDVVRAIEHLLEHDELEGVFNLVADNITQAEFSRTLRRVLGRPGLGRLPGFAVKAIYGEMGESLLLGGQRVSGAALAGSGFAYRYSELERALRALLGR